MSADLLRRAADKIRTTAGAADVLGQVADKITTSECPEFADHIAMWHPGVALAVADVLDRFASLETSWLRDPAYCNLARMILKEDS